MKTIGLAIACTLGFTACWPLLAWLAGAMGANIGTGDVAGILGLAWRGAVLFLVRGAFQYGQDTLMAKAALAIALKLRNHVYGHLQTLGLSFFETAKTGDLAYRLTEDIDRIGEVIYKGFHQFLPSVLQLLVVLGYMVAVNWQLTLAVLVVGPLMAVLIGFFGDRLLRYSRRSQNKISNLSALLTEVFSGMRLVQAFGAEEHEIQRFQREAEENRQAKFLAERLKAFQFVVVGFLEAMGVIFLFVLAAWQISRQTLTGAEFISYIAAIALLIDPIGITTNNFNEFKQGEASVDRIFELLHRSPQVKEKPQAQVLGEIRGQVICDRIQFSYGDQPTIQNLSLTANPGEMVALVGASGAGKSTLMNLLLRFYDCHSGSITIDGVDIREVTLKSLRRHMGIVPQETILFSGTIADNIAFGQGNWHPDQLETAAKIANAHGFISALPQGYHTYVGERGVNLSGGQKQRLAIARAIFRNPRILILDEATSALDSQSETLVQEALERIMEGRTVFVIAHRLATIRQATKILVLEQGCIVEEGTHDKLLAQAGPYARFYHQQFRGESS